MAHEVHHHALWIDSGLLDKALPKTLYRISNEAIKLVDQTFRQLSVASIRLPPVLQQ